MITPYRRGFNTSKTLQTGVLIRLRSFVGIAKTKIYIEERISGSRRPDLLISQTSGFLYLVGEMGLSITWKRTDNHEHDTGIPSPTRCKLMRRYRNIPKLPDVRS